MWLCYFPVRIRIALYGNSGRSTRCSDQPISFQVLPLYIATTADTFSPHRAALTPRLHARFTPLNFSTPPTSRSSIIASSQRLSTSVMPNDVLVLRYATRIGIADVPGGTPISVLPLDGRTLIPMEQMWTGAAALPSRALDNVENEATAILQLKDQGFTLLSMSTAVMGEYIITTLIFQQI